MKRIIDQCPGTTSVAGSGRVGRTPPFQRPRPAPAEAGVRPDRSRGEPVVGGAHDVGAPTVRFCVFLRALSEQARNIYCTWNVRIKKEHVVSEDARADKLGG